MPQKLAREAIFIAELGDEGAEDLIAFVRGEKGSIEASHWSGPVLSCVQ